MVGRQSEDALCIIERYFRQVEFSAGTEFLSSPIVTELRQDRELAKLIFGRPKLPSERRLSEHLAAYKDSDLAGLKRVNAALFDYLEPLADEVRGRSPWMSIPPASSSTAPRRNRWAGITPER